MGTPEHAPPRLGLAGPPTLRVPRRCRGHRAGPLCPGRRGGVCASSGRGSSPGPVGRASRRGPLPESARHPRGVRGVAATRHASPLPRVARGSVRQSPPPHGSAPVASTARPDAVGDRAGALGGARAHKRAL
jgi:hypothetical protein